MQIVKDPELIEILNKIETNILILKPIDLEFYQNNQNQNKQTKAKHNKRRLKTKNELKNKTHSSILELENKYEP